MTYGALGVVFGPVLRREVEGMFAVAMTSVVDITLQNPTRSSSTESLLVHYLPSHGAIQTATASAFSTAHTTVYLGLQALWFTAAALLALLTFHRRTRNALPPRADDAWFAQASPGVPPEASDVPAAPKRSPATSTVP
ncbi:MULTISPECIES: hypothetical protein [unclassified Streptomyces]|uniref:hypothetical protein n=1 Tax=unclassified Streptomyces TaxID=2593676 RepID=UPI002E13A263|nr:MULTISPECIES: hypothetical protein [unclassified Streptomyces]WSR28801.1 hypothetical protein OG573_32460 [Streptomyces sp. NBC_01205]